MTTQPAALTQVARQFQEFAAHCEGVAPLYAMLAPQVAADPALLELAAQVQPGQPPPNMLFAAVHYLLLQTPTQPLARYYATLGGSSAPDPQAFALFRAFCRTQHAALLGLISTRFTQTNEVQRSGYLLPGLALVQQLAAGRSLALIELGASAGLNLYLDRYGYRYSSGQRCGDRHAPVQLAIELRGTTVPPVPTVPPQIIWRVGIELHPIDLADPDARRWLEALVWPEHVTRLARLRAALAEIVREPPPLIVGDLLDVLAPQIALAPPQAALCVTHTHVLYQLNPAGRAQVDVLLQEASYARPIYRLGCEHHRAHVPEVSLVRYEQGRQQRHVLAYTSGHVDWLAWQPWLPADS